jgi:hypothetical protein
MLTNIQAVASRYADYGTHKAFQKAQWQQPLFIISKEYWSSKNEIRSRIQQIPLSQNFLVHSTR